MLKNSGNVCCNCIFLSFFTSLNIQRPSGDRSLSAAVCAALLTFTCSYELICALLILSVLCARLRVFKSVTRRVNATPGRDADGRNASPVNHRLPTLLWRGGVRKRNLKCFHPSNEEGPCGSLECSRNGTVI